MKIRIIDYRCGNIQSIIFALKRIGIHAVLTSNKEDIISSDGVIVPGVGEVGAAMTKLKDTGLDKIIPTLKQPVLGICVGLQLLCIHSEESDTKGLGIFDAKIKKLPPTLKVPHVGWNQIYGLKSTLFDNIEEDTYMYFVHSYYATLGKHTIAKTKYSVEYASALKFENFYGVQFHSEKSGDMGEKILENFISIVRT